MLGLISVAKAPNSFLNQYKAAEMNNRDHKTCRNGYLNESILLVYSLKKLLG